MDKPTAAIPTTPVTSTALLAPTPPPRSGLARWLERALDNPNVVGGLVGAAFGTLFALGLLAIPRRRRRPAWRRKAAGLREATNRAAAHPERVAQGEPRPVSKLALAVASTLATTATKHLVTRWLRP